jgi:hypothetical protein
VTRRDVGDERATAQSGSAHGIDAGPHDDHWDDVEVKLGPKRPRIAPGLYEAVSVSLRTFSAFNRENLELGFNVFDGAATDGVVLARIPKFFRKPARGKPLPPGSDLAAMFYLLGQSPRRATATNLRTLRGKLWRVEIADADFDSRQRKVATNESYSVVRRVVERL